MIEFDESDELDVIGFEGMSLPPTFFYENYRATVDNVTATELSVSKEILLSQYWDEVFEQLEQSVPENIGTGAIWEKDKLVNPGAYTNTNILDFTPMEIGERIGSFLGGSEANYEYTYRANRIYDFVAKNQNLLPEELKDLTPEKVDSVIKERAIEARERAEEIAARGEGSGAVVGRLAGGAVASFQDPAVQASAFLGASGASKSLLRLALAEAAIGGGTSAIMQPDIASWYEELGYDYDYKDFIRNVGVDALASAGLGVGVVLTGRQLSKGFEAFKKGGKASADSQAVANAAEDAADIEQSNPLENPESPQSQVEHEQRLAEATHSLETGKLANMPDETLSPAQVKDTIEDIIDDVENLDGVIFKVNARDVLVDAKRFQFKEGGDEYGVTERLQGITKWNPERGGTLILWEDLDGKIFVADGHQRAGLARRIMDQDPTQNINLYGYKLREADDISAEKARVIAAMANIAQGTGTVIDAAKVFRFNPDQILDLPPRSALVRDAKNLVNLDENAFRYILNDIITPEQGSLVGRLIDDPAMQEAAIQILAKTEPANLTRAEIIIRQVKEAGLITETQESLFGEELNITSLFDDRAKVLDRTIKILRSDKAAFSNLSRNAERIEAEGNKLRKDQNERLANENAQALALLQTLATRKGPLSDDLTNAATAARETGNYDAAAREYAGAVRRGIERGDFDRATISDAGRAVDGSPESRPSKDEEPLLDGFDEPTGPAVEEQKDQLILDTFREMDEAQPEQPRIESPIEEDRVELEQIRMPIDDDLPLDQVRAQVKALTDENVPLVKDLIARIDAKFGTKSGDNIKDLAKVTQKANRPSILAKKPWHKTSHIRDSYRFKTVIDDIRDVPAIFDELLASGISLVKVDTGKLFEPKEWGWRIIAFDLRMPNGQLVEWYLPIKELEAQKKAEGHLLFEEWRNKTPEEILEQNDSYMETIRKSWNGYDQAFQSSLDRMGISREDAAASWSKAESSMLEAARKSPSSSGMITSATVRGAEIQEPSIVRMAEEPSVQKSMARDVPSSISAKSVSGIEDTPRDLLTDIADDIKPEDFDLEVPLRTIDDEVEMKTMRDIKAELDADNALIARLGVCGL